MKLSLLFCALSFIVAVPQAQATIITDCTTVAGNLVTNCGFETGNFTGWTNSGFQINGNSASGTDAAYANGSVGHDDTLSENLLTSPGTVYTIVFDLNTLNDTPNQAIVSFGGTQVADLENVSVNGYQEYTYTAAATSSMSTLSFLMGNTPGASYLDNVSVTTPTPESATWGLMAGSIALAAGLRRRLSQRR